MKNIFLGGYGQNSDFLIDVIVCYCSEWLVSLCLFLTLYGDVIMVSVSSILSFFRHVRVRLRFFALVALNCTEY